MSTKGLFEPRTVQDVEERLARIRQHHCRCQVGPHEDALHDLAMDDVPWLIAQLAEAERRGAEKGWDECKDWFALLGPLNDHTRVSMNAILEAEEANPYRADQIAQGQP